MSHPTLYVDEGLKDFATDRQKQFIDAVNQHRSISAAAAALGTHKGNVWKAIEAVKRRAAREGYAPGHFEHGVAPGYRMGKVTVQRGPGGVERTWERQHPDSAHQEEQIREFVAWLIGDARSTPAASPATVATDLLAVYLFGDPHFGLRATAAESGEDFDLAEADRLTRIGIDRLADATPDAAEALLIVIGDNTHANDSGHLTPQNRNPLDMDAGGHNRSVLVSAKAWAYACRRLLEKHATVRLWFMPGNHDPDAAFALALCLSMYFETEPRLTVDLSPALYRYLRFGKVLIGAHHGHRAKQGDLPLLMAVDNPEDWGASSVRYIYMGHVHHDSVKEVQGVRVESIRSLAAKDAWHAAQGYRSMRDTRSIVHHREYGEVERHTVSAAMLTQDPA